MSRDQQSVQDMWNAAQEILSFTVDMSYDSLQSDRRTQAAVLYEVVVIGEAANRLSAEFRAKHSRVPWKVGLFKFSSSERFVSGKTFESSLERPDWNAKHLGASVRQSRF